MDVRLQFLGAAQGVTGSRYFLQTPQTRVLVDCGLYQERDLLARNWDPFPIPPGELDALLLTHAHLDHSGLIPKLVRDGFHGRIICTPATADLARIVWMDSARLQMEDAAFKKKRHARESRRSPFPEVPLYTTDDAEAAARLFQTLPYGEDLALAPDMTASFHDAGHILGSSMIRVTVRSGRESRIVLFSGDIGRWDRPILRDPTLFPEADYVLVESTYGDRVHEPASHLGDELTEVIQNAREAGGNVLIPSFAIERAQEVLYYLNTLLRDKRIPPVLVFLDSPMAMQVAQLMTRHIELLDADMKRLLDPRQSPFAFPGLTMVGSVEASKAINAIRGTSVIIAGSGMCTGGRIKHHLRNNLQRPESVVLFVGYQAVGTLGRLLSDGAHEVRLFGESCPVRAKIAHLHGLSSHADQPELMRWLGGLKKPPREVFVTHGEPVAATTLARLVKENLGWSAQVPAYMDVATLS